MLLRNQKTAAGDSGKEAKRLAKEVEQQEDFLSELRDFEDKLRRAANLHLGTRPQRWRCPEHRPATGTRPVERSQELLGRTPRRQV